MNERFCKPSVSNLSFKCPYQEPSCTSSFKFGRDPDVTDLIVSMFRSTDACGLALILCYKNLRAELPNKRILVLDPCCNCIIHMRLYAFTPRC